MLIHYNTFTLHETHVTLGPIHLLIRSQNQKSPSAHNAQTYQPTHYIQYFHVSIQPHSPIKGQGPYTILEQVATYAFHQESDT